MSGAVQPASSIRCLISGTAAAASLLFTVTRTSSEPASANSMHCVAVDAASAVSVIVIDCTTIGAPPPTWTAPTRTPTVLCRRTVDMRTLDHSKPAGEWGEAPLEWATGRYLAAGTYLFFPIPPFSLV